MLRTFRELTRAVFMACATLVITIISAHASGIKHMPSQSAAGAPRLFASPETERALGALAPYLPIWASMDVMVVSHEDVERHSTGHTGYIDAGYSGSFYVDDPREAMDRFIETLGDFPAERLEREGLEEALARDAADAIAHAYPMPARAPGEKPVCAIALPDMVETSPDQLVAAVSGLSTATADHIPGTVKAWRMIIIAHELAHCRHSYDDQRAVVGLAFEREADQFAIDIYRQYARELLGGADSDPAVPVALVSFRGIAGLRSEFITHSTSAALKVGSAALQDIDAVRLGEAKKMAQHAVWSMAATGKPDRDDHDVRRPHPSAMYEAARILYDSGYFDHTPLQKRYVRTFLDGAERFYPSYFQVRGERP